MDERAQQLELGDELGSGAVATVVRVVDRATGRSYAGKILHASHESDETAAGRFAREAELVRELDHPNLVRLHDTVEIDGRSVLLMELVEGPTLAEIIARESPLPQARIIALARGIARGLTVAHQNGIIHRDLKPANVLVGEGEVPKIADFGMARASSFAGVDRRTFTVLGTPDYMAPESLDPLAVDPRSDLYALGCIMYEIATGKPPYDGATPFAVIEQHRTGTIPELGPDADYSEGLRRLIAALLAKSPADRPQAASAVVDELERIGAGTTALVSGAEAGALASLAGSGRCARCGSMLVPHLDVCLDCGLIQAHLEAGRYSVFVVGPGGLGDKMDSRLREGLLDWIASNPSLQLDAAPLARRIPRLPFLLVRGVSEGSAAALAHSLEQLGLRAKVARGGALALPEMRKKASVIGGRATGIVAVSLVYIGMDAFWRLAMWVALLFGAFFVTAGLSVRALTRRIGATRRPLPESLQDRMHKIATVAPTIRAKRHRESMRAVVSRALGVRKALPADSRHDVDGEVGEAIDVALVAAARMDALDSELADADLREPTAEVREKIKERDTWAGRLLDLTALLEGLRARLAAAEARKDASTNEGVLEELRARIEALEEVQHA